MKKKNGFLVILIILSAFISIEMPIAILMKSPPALIGVLFVFSIFLAVMWFICILIKNRRGASSSKNESGAESPITPAPTGRAPTAPAPSGRAPTALAPKEIVYLYDEKEEILVEIRPTGSYKSLHKKEKERGWGVLEARDARFLNTYVPGVKKITIEQARTLLKEWGYRLLEQPKFVPAYDPAVSRLRDDSYFFSPDAANHASSTYVSEYYLTRKNCKYTAYIEVADRTSNMGGHYAGGVIVKNIPDEWFSLPWEEFFQKYCAEINKFYYDLSSPEKQTSLKRFFGYLPDPVAPQKTEQDRKYVLPLSQAVLSEHKVPTNPPSNRQRPVRNANNLTAPPKNDKINAAPVADRADDAGCELIPGSVREIAADSYYKCTHLKKVIIGEGVTDICNSAFLGCSGLETIVLPESLELVCGDGTFGSDEFGKPVVTYQAAFAECDHLKKILYRGTEEQWKKVLIEPGNDCLFTAEIVFGYRE